MSTNLTIPNSLLNFISAHTHLTTFTCSRQSTRHGYRLHQRVINDYNLIFVTRGRPVWVIDGQPIELSPQSLLIVPPHVKHQGHSKTQRVTLLSLHMLATLPGGQDVFELISLPRLQQVAAGGRLDGYLRGAMNEFDGEGPRRAGIMAGWVHLVFLELLHDNAQQGLICGKPLDPVVADMLEELNKRVAAPTRLDDLAQLAGYSAQHLNRVFGKALGLTPMQYLQRIRMERASQMLLTQPLTVAAVGRAVGFEDPYYFSRIFKQHVGRSPREHRQMRDSDTPSSDSSTAFSG